ncbi:MAG TPA: glycine zipper 2TM domain-containing protein [Sphingomonas sp.]|jgi:hypothetical protein
MLTRLLTAGLAIATLSTATPALAQSAQDDARFAAAQARLDSEMRVFRQEFDRYQSLRSRGGNSGPYRRAPEPRYDNGGGYDQAPDDRDEGSYDPSRYYRVGPNYQERVLSTHDRVYSGSDGRYYCKRSDGTTGLIVGAAGGGILGNVIDGGRSRTVGTLLGAAVGGLAGRAVEQNNGQVRCR